MAVLYDDVNRWRGLDPIVEQTWIVKDCPRDLTPDAIVIERRWQYFNLIVHALHAFQALYAGFGRILHNGVTHLAGKRDGAPIYAVGQIIEHGKLRDHIQLMPDLAGKPLLQARI